MDTSLDGPSISISTPITNNASERQFSPNPYPTRTPIPTTTVAVFQGYGARPTTNILIGIVFTLSECSPNAASALGASPKGGSGGASNNGGSGGEYSGGGSGLTAGMDALRLVCLQCLEVSKYV